MLAKAMAIRFAHPLNSVIDPTQSAFLPERWIGNNVLFHLEEIDYSEFTRRPGAIAFLDFAKADDVVIGLG